MNARSLGAFGIAVGFLGCIPAANYLMGNVGTTCIPDGPCLVPVAPGGLMAPSGVLLIGAALALRDALHERLGRWPVAACIVVGAVASLAFSPTELAMASGGAFLLSELLDFAIYDRFRRLGMAWAVFLSGLAGAVADSLLFSWWAFGTPKWALGLVLAKLYASIGFALWLGVFSQQVSEKNAR